MRVSTTKQVVVFLKHKRRVQFSCSRNHQLGGRTRSAQGCARTKSSHRLTRAAMRAENIIGGDTSTAKTAIDRLHLNSLATNLRRCAKRHLSGHYSFQMTRERIAQRSGRREK